VIRTVQIGRDSAAIRRAVQAGSLHPKYRGVYAVGHPKLSREGEWLAAVYAAGEGAALTGNLIHAAAFIKRWDERAATRTTPVLRAAIALYNSGSAGTRSGLEDRFLKLIRGARLPEPVINTPHLGFELNIDAEVLRQLAAQDLARGVAG